MQKPLQHIAAHIKHPGATRAAAERAGESTEEWAEQHKHDKGAPGTPGGVRRARATSALAFIHASKRK